MAVSPELALVDPLLAERLRGELPEPDLDWRGTETEAAGSAQQSQAQPLAAPEPGSPRDVVHVLRPLSAVAPTPPSDKAAVGVSPTSSRSPDGSESRGSAVVARRTIAAFCLGAVVASLVVVGVVAKLGEAESPDVAIVSGGSSPCVVPPTTASPPSRDVGRPPRAVAPPTGKPTTKPAPRATRRRAPSPLADPARSPTTSTVRPRRSTPPPNKQATDGPRQRAAATSPAQVAPTTRRFSWAPVEGAVGYRIELFRGDERILRRSTKRPVLALTSPWRYRGRVQRLVPGAYRWSVWPVLQTGLAPRAVVQASLDVS